jgi:hypothetical protein
MRVPFFISVSYIQIWMTTDNVILSSFAFAIAIAIVGCQKNENQPVRISCPSGTQLMGEMPPKGDEVWCQKTVNGEAVKEGPIVLYRESGLKMMEGNYKNGKQDGEWTLYYETGGKKSVDHYKNGVQEGEHIGWYENGQIAAKGQYKNGEQDGLWKRWGPDGIKNWEEVYKDGKKVS